MRKEKELDLTIIADIDKVIHSPARMMIMVYLLAVNLADFTFLLNQTGLSRGNLSTHLSALEAAGYISVKKEFVEKIPRTLMEITSAGRNAIAKYRAQMLSILDELLKA